MCAGETGLFELLMRRYNQRVYRVARSVLRDDAEAEELTQEIWVRAFTHLAQFAGRSRFSTWLTRIALHEAWARARRSRRFESLETGPAGRWREHPASGSSDPEHEAVFRQLQAALENAVDSLPPVYRTVFVLREIEEMSTEQTAEALELTKGAVKVRLHRARALLRRELQGRAGFPPDQTFPFRASRCDHTVQMVFSRIQTPTSGLSRGATP